MQYNLDSHAETLLQQYNDRLPIFQRIEQLAYQQINDAIQQQGLYVTGIEHRIKGHDSLAGKLELKGAKYNSLEDITDIFGLRVITFYADDVDKVAAIARNIFDVDWKESIDKRKTHKFDSFGYNSLHYICRLPKTVIDDPDMPQLNQYRFELQMRTALQHVWSTIQHDTGYKSDVKIPAEYHRQFSRLSGMLELIDDEFSRIRNQVTEYQRSVQSLVASGKLDEVILTADSFRNYLHLRPFDKLTQRIAATNQAEIVPTPLMPYLRVFQKEFDFSTLGDVDRFITEETEDAYQLAVSRLAVTDLDIISEDIGIQSLCIVHILKNGGGRPALRRFFSLIYGPHHDHTPLVEITLKHAATMPFL